MFQLIEVEDVVGIPAQCLDRDLAEIVTTSLESKYCNRVIPDGGLAIAVYDLVKLSSSHIMQGDSTAHLHVRARLIAFAPREDEILVGKIIEASPSGMRLSVGFFTDIFISPAHMMPDTEWSEQEQLWVWSYIVDEGSEPLLYHFDLGASCRFRVGGVTYYQPDDAGSSRPNVNASLHGGGAKPNMASSAAASASKKPSDKEAPAHTALDGSFTRQDGRITTAAQTPEQAAAVQAKLNQSLMAWVTGHVSTSSNSGVAHDTAAGSGPAPAPSGDAGSAGKGRDIKTAREATMNPAMTIAGSVAELGLGVVAWWAEVSADAAIDEDLTVNGERIAATAVVAADDETTA